jgi:hypothetical protein
VLFLGTSRPWVMNHRQPSCGYCNLLVRNFHGGGQGPTLGCSVCREEGKSRQICGRRIGLSVWCGNVLEVPSAMLALLCQTGNTIFLGVPNSLLPYAFPTKILHASISSPMCASCSVHLILLDFILTKTSSYEAPNYVVLSSL